MLTPHIDLGLAQKPIPNWGDGFMAEGRVLIVDDHPFLTRGK
jgi:hypothetical protein